MCGLVGMAGDLTFKHRSVMKDLLFFNTLRGRDSTGVAALDIGKNTLDTKKVTLPGFEFISLPFIDNLLSPCVGVWIGHGRARTVGDVSRLNAHPFEVRNERGGITLFGAHNGTLKNKFDIEKELDGDKFGTDSEALLNLINKVGAKEALHKADGAWALTYWTSEDGRLKIIRNKERPLYYAYSEDRKTLIWASEMWMIRIACDRHDLKLSKNTEGNPSMFLAAEDTLYAWDIPTFKYNAEEKDKSFGTPEREGGVVGKPESRFRGHVQGAQGGWYGDVDWFGADDSDKLASDVVSQAAKKAREKGKTNEGTAGSSDNFVTGFCGKPVDKALALEFVRAGCDWCGGRITGGYGWMDEMNLVCHDCLHGSHIDVDPQQGTISLRVIEGGKK